MKTNAKKTIQQAAEWRLASLLLSRPCNNWQDEVRALAHETCEELLQNAAREALQNASEESYLAFIGPAGNVSPREIAYIGLEDPGLVLADILHFYESFHYEPTTEDPIDHIAVQTGFAGFLTLKKAYAISTNNYEARKVTEIALQHFLERHLARLIRGVANRTAGESSYVRMILDYLLRTVDHVPLQPVAFTPDLTEETVHCGLQ